MSKGEGISVSSKRALVSLLVRMERDRLLQRVLVGLLLAAFVGAALYLRVHFTSDVVFGGRWIKFTGIDAYWHARILDNLSRNFPYMAAVDPYLLYPGGAGTSLVAPFFDYLIAGVAWVIGLGSPSQHTVDVVAVLFPPILGALTVIPAYYIGKALGSRWAGLFAALLVAVLPGEFLGRSILGFTDHHVGETFLSTVAAMFLLLALKGFRKERLTWPHLRHPRQSSLARPLALAVLGGVFLGLYLSSWIGALLFVLVFGIFFVLQFCIDHVRGVPTDYLGIAGVATFLPALVVFMALGQSGEVVAVLALATVMPVALFGLSRLMERAASAVAARGAAPASGKAARDSARARAAGAPPGGWGPARALYPVVVALAMLAAFLLLWAAKGSLLGQMTEHFVILKWNTGTSVSEMIPFLWQRTATGGYYSLKPLWSTYGYTTIAAAAGLALLAWAVVRRREPEKVLLLVWTALMVLATLAQRRFNYYLAVNMAALAGYAAWHLLRLVGLKWLTGQAAPAPEARRKGDRGKKKARPQAPRLKPAYASVALVGIALFAFFTVVPYDKRALPGSLGVPGWIGAIDLARATADRAPEDPLYEPSDAWCESLEWMRNNTPDPFDTHGQGDYYYACYPSPLEYSRFPEAYGVMAWWDYGYWIARIGRRPPCQNPGGALPGVAEFFIASSEAEAAGIMEQYGGRYVILDSQLMDVYAKFYGPFSVTGRDEAECYETFLVETAGSEGTRTYSSKTFFYPAYYRCISVRLYFFEGRGVAPSPGACKVVTWEPVQVQGREYKLVTRTEAFDSYAAAEAAIASKPSPGNCAIVSDDPRVSPVPLEELADFTLVHDSAQEASLRAAPGAPLPQIRIFEYTG